ncbi:uncharacterized protein BDW47DRAFT_98778 [Aspergillus candidus]|uniref:Uncharacterized protein n=1 Tax=Aspergillus candidus TaxID=41067 RepID=A0A2I2FMR8_ASPCN|nr:hypothetical protein BDW47DRAFT_98778 [Aspergillus candidus]PLB41909.1 hypothetical protein BDW47DRAFT_98778 [Aspergillus candidus]
MIHTLFTWSAQTHHTICITSHLAIHQRPPTKQPHSWQQRRLAAVYPIGHHQILNPANFFLDLGSAASLGLRLLPNGEHYALFGDSAS